MNGYQYRCRVSNSAGTVYSNAVTLTVYPATPTITKQPYSTSATHGEKVSFSVSASGGALSYQWQYLTPSSGSWTNSSGTNYNKANFTPTASYAMNGYQYRCRVSNSAGTVYSDVVTLTVYPATPSITKQPVSTSATAGSKASFSISATGGGLSYQWQYRKTSSSSWADSRGINYNKANFTPDVSSSMNGWQYRCRVSNSAGTVYSNVVTLTVNATAPKITKQPVSTSADAGTRASFSVTASGSGLSYQWQYRKTSSSSWTDSRGINYNKANFTPDVSSSMNGYQYRCRVSNSAGTVYSNVVTLTVNNAAPSITKQPVSTSANAGTRASFSVTASGSGLSYQWQYRKTSSSSWTDSRGINYNKANFTPDVGSSMNGYQYRCRVSNSVGTVYSNVVTLTVYKPATESDWVLESQAPAGAEITARSWSYRESTSSTSSSMSGWVYNGSRWEYSSSDSKQYCDSFPNGFDTSNSIYTRLNGSPYSGWDDGSTKREVSNSWAGYVYWHWMYDCGGANAYNRCIAHKKGYSSDVANSNFNYKYFGAFTSTNNYGTVGNQWGQSGVYQWYHVTDRKSYADTQGSYYWYRVNYYTSSYTDYTKYYDYYRDLYYQTTDPGNGSNISNKVAYVKYKL